LEIGMNLTSKFDIVNRPAAHFIFLERRGPFSETAPSAWEALFPTLGGQIDHKNITEVLGLGRIERTPTGKETMIYQAGVTVGSAPDAPVKGLQYKKIESGKYARFVLTGPYSQIGVAFSKIFQTLAEQKVALREDFCIEKYLNDPQVTPEDQLMTELLIPMA
jgi:AraC family transcriptional regulator